MPSITKIKNRIFKKQHRLEVIDILFKHDCFEDRKMTSTMMYSLINEENQLRDWLEMTAKQYPELAKLCN